MADNISLYLLEKFALKIFSHVNNKFTKWTLIFINLYSQDMIKLKVRHWDNYSYFTQIIT